MKYTDDTYKMFLLDLLDNLPRLRLSKRHMKMVLWVMKECGAVDVPSLYALHEVQAKLQGKCGVSTEKCMSSVGNILYVNNIVGIIAKVSPH